jgi:hypothetical protein
MDLASIRQLVSIRLGEQTAFYVPAEIDRSGINPAQRLLCLTYPALLRQRATLTVTADNPFIDLRTLQNASGITIGNRLRTVRRVVLGNVMADAPVRNAATDELTDLQPTTVRGRTNRSRAWLRDRGQPKYYYLHGGVWLGLYKRPVAATTVTVIFDATPNPLVNDADIPQVQEVYHRVIADIAFGLLLVKEGIPQGAQGLRVITEALGIARQQEAVT